MPLITIHVPDHLINATVILSLATEMIEIYRHQRRLET
ncbi:PTS lactose/cellobiose transporter subunit IIA [Yersinia ruckeri]|nr:PTS lactose/cellobiose transporter subunit IIA [Yersinia ruckeri]UIM97735.1 PTS lactose/cellobiose transporter subunit IIA [Yersinia ruckeri]